MRLPWLLSALGLAALIAFLEFYALAEHLYWYYPWFDVPMHILGGVVIATTLVALLRTFRPLWFFLSCAAVFIGWEIFEYQVGIPRETNYAFDTALDLLDDAIGAILVYAVARFSIWR